MSMYNFCICIFAFWLSGFCCGMAFDEKYLALRRGKKSSSNSDGGSPNP